MSGGAHYVWGDVESIGGDHSDSNSDARSLSTGGAAPSSGGPDGGAQPLRNSGGRRFPPEVHRYMADVSFITQSSSSSLDSEEHSSRSLRKGGGTPNASIPDDRRQLLEQRLQQNLRSDDLEGGQDPETEEEELLQPHEAESLDEILQETMAGIMWSKGSAKHSVGKCKPCHYFHTNAGCLGGRDCRFCHIPHTRGGKSRVGMSKRILCKRIADALEQKYTGDPEGFQLALTTVSSRSPFLRRLLEQRAKELATGMGDASSSSGPAAAALALPPQQRPPATMQSGLGGMPPSAAVVDAAYGRSAQPQKKKLLLSL